MFNDGIKVALDRDEAIVLFELLARWMHDAPKAGPAAECFESRAELHVLRQVRERLEVRLSEPSRPGYLERVAAARRRYEDEVVGDTLQD